MDGQIAWRRTVTYSTALWALVLTTMILIMGGCAAPAAQEDVATVAEEAAPQDAPEAQPEAATEAASEAAKESPVLAEQVTV